MFIVAAGVYIFGAVFFGLFVSGEEQPWNRVEDTDTTSTGNVGPIISAEDPNDDTTVSA